LKNIRPSDMKRKLLFPLVAALLLVPWPIAYAFDEVKAANLPLTIAAAEPSLAPKMEAFGNAIGGVTPGDLFQVDTSGIVVDTQFTIYLTNTDELIHSYRYMTLNIGIYVQTDTDRWERATASNGDAFQDVYLTMQNGLVSFTLPGNARYKITIEKGCFYCYGVNPGESIASPEFNLTAS
jgi:hypothetical protein